MILDDLDELHSGVLFLGGEIIVIWERCQITTISYPYREWRADSFDTLSSTKV